VSERTLVLVPSGIIRMTLVLTGFFAVSLLPAKRLAITNNEHRIRNIENVFFIIE
jgi:hypothetical protein